MGADLEIYTLGGFEVVNGRQIVTEGVKKTSKRWKLLQYLLTYRQREISREELIMGLGLNSNSDPEGSLSALIYRLRRKLNGDKDHRVGRFIQTSGGSYTFNQRADYWFDAEEFEKLCRRTERMVAEKSHKALEAFSRAVEIYSGDYLEESRSEEWVWTARNYYRDLLVSTMLELDDFMQEEEEYQKLWELYEQVHRLIKYDERLITGGINALISAGRTGMARLKYEEAMKMFEENELSVPPELRELGEKLNSDYSDDPDEFLADLQDCEESEGAFVCDPQIFTRLYELEKRRSQRDVPPRSVIHMRLAGECENAGVKNIGDSFMDLISNQLRCGDIVCRWNDKHFVALLADVSGAEVKKVSERLINSFTFKYDMPGDLEIEERSYEL